MPDRHPVTQSNPQWSRRDSMLDKKKQGYVLMRSDSLKPGGDWCYLSFRTPRRIVAESCVTCHYPLISTRSVSLSVPPSPPLTLYVWVVIFAKFRPVQLTTCQAVI
ncbi:hypothetical protein TNCT_168111 [Trichonephila clavata]|uniref:Uncharacterized protein n=1 Tax=Trichonephila clavata TaxID=2740835 RepID=A0A8X6K5B4_TRICU|nr:hypothetical protein TNCT_168111 [Trichonephila clavata]